MNIKLVNQTQLKLIADLDNKNNLTPWSYTDYFNSFYQSNQHIYVLTQSQQIYGVIVFSLYKDEMEILQLWIDKHYRQCGYAKMLMQFLLSTGKKKSITAIYLEVRKSNISAINLYLSFSFKEIGVRKNYYHTSQITEDALVMQCIL